MTQGKFVSFTLAALAAASVVACSSTPDRSAALNDARGRYAALQATPDVGTHAAQELARAAAAMRLAEAAHAAGDGSTSVEHLAYLARQRIVIAQATTTSRVAQAVTAGAATERDRLRLDLRTAEADAAQRQLLASQQAAQQDAARSQAERDRAARSAQDDRARLASSDARVDDLEAQLRELNARRTERGIVVTLGDMLFDSGRAQLQAGGTRSVTQLAEFLTRHPQRSAVIEGHTDSVGSRAANMDLSDRRAQSVLAALVGLGVGADRLQATGQGPDSPVASNGSAAGRQMNRRVEVVFAPEPGDLLRR
jgi:outer membrane protein OmpA-like peptidoglycan-associated protein